MRGQPHTVKLMILGHCNERPTHEEGPQSDYTGAMLIKLNLSFANEVA